jgi:hypothetical protein
MGSVPASPHPRTPQPQSHPPHLQAQTVRAPELRRHARLVRPVYTTVLHDGDAQKYRAALQDVQAGAIHVQKAPKTPPRDQQSLQNSPSGASSTTSPRPAASDTPTRRAKQTHAPCASSIPIPPSSRLSCPFPRTPRLSSPLREQKKKRKTHLS